LPWPDPGRRGAGRKKLEITEWDPFFLEHKKPRPASLVIQRLKAGDADLVIRFVFFLPGLMLFFLWPVLLANQMGVFLCQMVSAAFFAASAGVVLEQLPAPTFYNFLFRASVVLGGMLLFGLMIALVVAVCAISVYVAGLFEASYAPFLVFGPSVVVFVIFSFCFWPMYALPVVWRWRKNGSDSGFDTEEDWYGYHIWPGLKDSFQAALQKGNWFRYGLLAVSAQWAIPVALYFSSLPLVTSADLLRHALIGGLCLPCIHLIIVHNTYQAFKTTRPGNLTGEQGKRGTAKDQFKVEIEKAFTRYGGPLPPYSPGRLEKGLSKKHQSRPVYESSAERPSVKKGHCACNQLPHWPLSRHEQHLFSETWESMHTYPGFTVAPWTPTKEEHRIVFCSSCHRLWCLKYIGYDDAFVIQEMPSSSLSIIGKDATTEKLIHYVQTEDYAAGKLCLDDVPRIYFSIAAYPLPETADLIISAVEHAHAIGPAKELLTLLRWVVLRAKKDSIHPKLHIPRFRSVLKVLNRPMLYERCDPTKAAYAKYDIYLILKDMAQYGFPPSGDVLSIPPADKRKLVTLTDPDEIIRLSLERMAEIHAAKAGDHMRTIVESAVFLSETMTSNARLSIQDINVLITLLNALYEVNSRPEDQVAAAHQYLYQLLEKAYAYDIIPDQCRASVYSILHSSTA